MAKAKAVKKQGPRGPMTAAHKKKIGAALKRKWRERKFPQKIEVVQAMAKVVGHRTMNDVLADLLITSQRQASLYDELKQILGV